MTQGLKSPLDVDLQQSAAAATSMPASLQGSIHLIAGLFPDPSAVFGPASASREFRILREVGADTLDLELSAVHRQNGLVGKADRPVRLTWLSKKVLL